MSNLGYAFEISSVDSYRDLYGAAWPHCVMAVSGSVYRVEGSGRNKLATKTGSDDSILEGDVVINFKALFDAAVPETDLDLPVKGILQENKHYKSKSAQKSFTIQKGWLDQARHEAGKEGMLTVVALKFKGISPTSTQLKQYNWYGTDGNSVHYMVPHIDWLKLLGYVNTLIKKVHMLSSISTGDRKETLASFSDEELCAELKLRLCTKEKT